jgi:hypothetical protein
MFRQDNSAFLSICIHPHRKKFSKQSNISAVCPDNLSALLNLLQFFGNIGIPDGKCEIQAAI